MTPKRNPGRSRDFKINIFVKLILCLCFWSVPGVQKDTKNHTKIKKTRFRSVFFNSEKNKKIQIAFFSFLDAPGKDPEPENTAKCSTVVQNRCSQLLMKKLTLFKKCYKIVPTGHRKRQENQQKSSRNSSRKAPEKSTFLIQFRVHFWIPPISGKTLH